MLPYRKDQRSSQLLPNWCNLHRDSRARKIVFPCIDSYSKLGESILYHWQESRIFSSRLVFFIQLSDSETIFIKKWQLLRLRTWSACITFEGEPFRRSISRNWQSTRTFSLSFTLTIHPEAVSFKDLTWEVLAVSKQLTEVNGRLIKEHTSNSWSDFLSQDCWD